MTYTVTAPYVTLRVKDRDGHDVTVGYYEGGRLPDDCNADDVERLLRKNMIADAESAQGLMAAPAGTPKPGEPPNVAVTEIPVSSLPLAERQKIWSDAGAKTADKPATDGRPAQAAPKADWVAYAVSQRGEGVSEEDARAAAEAKSKADLIAQYGNGG